MKADLKLVVYKLLNCLIFNKMQEGMSCVAKHALLRCDTCSFAAQKGMCRKMV